MTTLAEFLLARIWDDQTIAESARVHVDDLDGWPAVTAAHVLRHDPARVLAECEAKRRIVERYRRHERDVTPHGVALDDSARFALEDTVRDLAQTYADHPAYRQEWRP